MTELAKWQNFYVIVGSAGAARIGVQFVVVTLVSSLRKPTTADSLHAFGTPTVVYLGSALLLSAIMTAPWPSLTPASVVLGTCGLCGLGYGAVIIRRARRQTEYQPVWEDWLWYAAVPSSLYAAVALAALSLYAATELALFLIGGAALGFLLTGIRNAWDTVTHLVVSGAERDRSKND